MRSELLAQLAKEQRALAISEWREERHDNAVELEMLRDELRELRAAVEAMDRAPALSREYMDAIARVLTAAQTVTAR